jgi:hypothetical protein
MGYVEFGKLNGEPVRKHLNIKVCQMLKPRHTRTAYLFLLFCT